MSSTIESTWDRGRTAILTGLRNNEINFAIYEKGAAKSGITSPRSEFIAAVEKELDATVILHSDLPEVVRDGNRFSAGEAENGDPYSALVNGNPNWTWQFLLNTLAVYRHMENNPPVDEKQVEAITAALYEATSDPSDINVPDVARRLVQQGVRVEVTE